MLRYTKRRLALLGAGAAGVAALVLSVPAFATGGYRDTAGDGTGAPDIGQIDVASDAAGQVLFTIHVDNWPSPSDARLLLCLDTDMNVETGAPNTYGGDYFLGVSEADNSFGFFVWNGADYAETPYSTVRVHTNSTGVTISVNRSELGNTGEFNFWVRTLTGDASANQADDSPNDGVWNYALAANGPNILGLAMTMSPGFGPVAGKPFTVKSVNLKLPPSGEPLSLMPSPDMYTCTATLAGHRLAGTGTGGCTWVIPKKKTRGKRLVVTVTVSYQGATKTVPFAFTVR